MIEILLKPWVFEVLLVVGAVVLFGLSFWLEKQKILTTNHATALRIFAPATVLLYGLQILLQSLLGFASIWVVLVMLAIAIGVGFGIFRYTASTSTQS